MTTLTAPPPERTHDSTVEIKPAPHGAGHVLTASMWLPLPRREVFPFFADARNLEAITPPLLRFEIVTKGEIDMRKGALIDYRIRIRGVPVRWRTRIAAWDPGVRFIDEQIRGPYRLWEHEHTFEDEDGGTRIGDRVRYRAPGGAIVNALLVQRDLLKIFNYRQQRIRELLTDTDPTSRAGSPDPAS